MPRIPVSTRIDLKSVATLLKYYRMKYPAMTVSSSVRLAVEEFTAAITISDKKFAFRTADEAIAYLNSKKVPLSIAREIAKENGG